MTKPAWTFLTNHAQVLLFVAHNEHSTAREIAMEVGITERAVQRLLDDLEDSGYLQRHKEGRSNHYTVDLEQPLRHSAQRGQPVRELMTLLLHYLDSPVTPAERAGLRAETAASEPLPPSAPTVR